MKTFLLEVAKQDSVAFGFGKIGECRIEVRRDFLALIDPSPQVQNWSLTYLKDFALQDFSTNYNGGLEWISSQENRHRFPADVQAMEIPQLANSAR